MLVDEAAAHLVQDYVAVVGQPTMSGFRHIISVLCYLYPAVPQSLVTFEVVRSFSKSEPLGKI